MKLSLTFLPLLSIAAAAAVLVKRDRLPSKFTLEASTQGLEGILWPELHWLDGECWIGNSKYNSGSQKLQFSSGGDGDGLSFTSFHSTPTGWTDFWIFPDESRAAGFTTPHSAFVPEGASTKGFEKMGDQLAYKGRMEWQACDQGDGSWKIFWDGAHDAGCVPVGLYITEIVCTSTRMRD
ncbi:hypothetical protein L873DRAFT_1740520 [Choiromyces venosus 120613-1]|uniref:Uncharacterized protein n=1 Tax=Choiromyces venosus 120613-1 TaxID=1336337 RepID=A0A3N4JJD4_9PEZI|nr:hypothetical protein L873DRAFT_1740520 [Choiromyces venosus 120613-1]